MLRSILMTACVVLSSLSFAAPAVETSDAPCKCQAQTCKENCGCKQGETCTKN